MQIHSPLAQHLTEELKGSECQSHRRREPMLVLRDTLAKLAHLNLTGRIRYDDAPLKTHDGSCDVFTGSASISSEGCSLPEQCRNIKVAIKRLRVHLTSDRDFARSLVKELYIWSKLDHINILPLLGYVVEGDYPSVVSEWVENGTIVEYLKRYPNADSLCLIIGIANGLEYLHGCDIVHSDLKADNILVDRSGNPLIIDFGISHMLHASISISGTSTGRLNGTIRWMVIELFDLSGNAHHTKETDVWAFGMTIYEMLSKEVPYAHLKIDILVMFAIIRGELPSRPSVINDGPASVRALWKICEACWISPPQQRFTMKKIGISLGVIKAMNGIDEGADSREKGLTELITSRAAFGETDSKISWTFDLPRSILPPQPESDSYYSVPSPEHAYTSIPYRHVERNASQELNAASNTQFELRDFGTDILVPRSKAVDPLTMQDSWGSIAALGRTISATIRTTRELSRPAGSGYRHLPILHPPSADNLLRLLWPLFSVP